MIIKHMKTDPNAVKHADAGLIAFVFTASWCVVIMLFVGSFDFINLLMLSQAASFAAGVAIEIGQRIYRGIKKQNQNTYLESLLDIMQTGLWYVNYYVNKGK